ncbi:MAG: hypothetical protein ABMB14_36670 [Myxococcota bacterium]
MVLWLTGAAFAQGYQPPNSTIGPAVGYPWLIGGRGEAWFGDEITGELGAGTGSLTDGADGDGLGVDLTFRWRPDALCFGCESRVQASFGVGLTGLVTPDLALDGPWGVTVGPDLAMTALYWFSPTYGIALTIHGGAGAGWLGDDFDAVEVRPWGFATVGLAF